MRILFVSFENPNSIGVTQKLGTQLKYMRKCASEANGLIINASVCKSALPEGWSQICYPLKKIKTIWNRRFLRNCIPLLNFINNRRARITSLHRFLSVNHVDVVYLRYPTSDYYLYRLLKKHKNITWIYEHNSMELPELMLNKNKWEDGKWVLRFEKIFAKKCLKLATGIVGVTNEIVQYELKRLGEDSPTFVIGNGIDNESIDVKKINQKKKYNGVFLIGSYNDWHGIDLLPEIISQANERIHITVVGEVPKQVKQPLVSNNITFVSAVNHMELDEFLRTFDFGIGTLALHRINMIEAVSLKTRAYVKIGLPVVLNYNDTDLKDLNGVFKWNSDEKQVKKLLHFLDSESSLTKENIALAIGAENKMKNLYEFVKTLKQF